MIDLVATEDGSLSRLDPETGELFHNRAGAYREALENYCLPANPVALLSRRNELRVLDACFGLGYNTFVLLQHLIEQNCAGRITVIAIELDPAPISALPLVLRDPRLVALSTAMSTGMPDDFGNFHWSSGALHFNLNLQKCDLRQSVQQLPEEGFDLIFHDPFSPRRAPHLWTADIFKRYYQALPRSSGAMITYSAAVAVRGGLLEAGFQVFRTTAVGKKTGGTLATTDIDYQSGGSVYPLPEEEVKRLQTRSAVPYRDSTFTKPKDNILKERAAEQAGW